MKTEMIFRNILLVLIGVLMLVGEVWGQTKIPKPDLDNIYFTYDGSWHTVNLNPPEDYYSLSGNTKLDAGNYTATVTLNDPDNYEWDDDSGTDPFDLSWTIAKATPTASDLSYTIPTPIYNSSPQGIGSVLANPSITGLGSISLPFYEGFSTTPPTNAGTYAVTVNVGEGMNYTAKTGIELGNYTIAPQPVNAALIIAPPATGGNPGLSPYSTVISSSGAGYSCSPVSWTPLESPPGLFLGDTEYTATVTLTVDPNYEVTNATINSNNVPIVLITSTELTISYKFPKTTPKSLLHISIVSQPTKLSYIHGEALDMSGLTVRLHYNDGSTDDVPFSGSGFTTSPANGTLLNSSHNNQPVVVSYSVHSVNTNPLTVAAPTYGISLSESGTYNFPSAIFGYGTQTARSVTVTNTGNQLTGSLTVALSGSNPSNFTLSGTSVSSIAVGGNVSFTVVPNDGLSVGTYTETVTISGDNAISETFNISFTVTPAPTYGVALNQSGTYIFSPVNSGYSALTPLPVTVWNTGNQPTGTLTVALSGADAGSFTLSETSVSSIAVGGNDAFTVVPISGLSDKTYTATVKVSDSNGISANFDVSFTVIPVSNFSVSLSESGTYNFPFTIFGYGAQTARSVTVTNTGNQPTGPLTVALSGSNPSNFTLSGTPVSSIAVGGNDAFTVVPNSGLPVGTHTATVTVLGSNGISANFNVSFEVKAIPINSADITVIAPTTAGIPNFTATPVSSPVNFTPGAVSWSPALSPTNRFRGGTRYTATVTLTANDNYTFDAGTAAKINGFNAIIDSNNGSTLTISYQFDATPLATVNNISILTHPSKLIYTENESLNLAGLTVKIDYNDGTFADNVTPASFGLYGITTTPANNATLTMADDGKPVEVTHSCNCVQPTNPIPPLTVNSYKILLSTTGTHTFPSAFYDYGSQTPLTVTITNTGNRPTGALTVALSGSNPSRFQISETSTPSIAVNGDFTFEVTPVIGLVVSTYTARVTVSGSNGISANFTVSFTVNVSPISFVDIYVTHPVTGEKPNAIVTGLDNFSGVVSWTPGHDPFRLGETYNATVRLTVKDNYTFTGLTSVTINDNAVTTFTNDGTQLRFTYPFTTALMDQLPLTIDPPLSAKTYGDVPFQLTTSGGSGTGLVTYTYVSGPGSVTPNGLVSITGAGNIIISATKAGVNQYNPVTSNDLIITVGKKNLTITGLRANNKEYDGLTTATPITTAAIVVGITNNDDVTVIDGTAAFNDKNAANGKPVTFSGYALDGSKANNYTLSQPAGVTADITAKPVTITGVGAGNKEYDGSTTATPITTAATLVGIINNDDVKFNAGTATFNDKNAANGKPVTFSGFTLGGDDADNYTLTAQPAGVTAAIIPKSLTINGFHISKVYDGNNIVKGFGPLSFSGFAGGESAYVVSSSVNATYSATRVGEHDITFEGNFGMEGGNATPGNYTITQPEPAEFQGIITYATATIPTAATDLVYNGLEQTGVAGGAGYRVDEGGTATLAGNYNATVLLLANYEWPDGSDSDSRNIPWSISHRPVTITGFNITKVYDNNNTVLITSFGSLKFDGLVDSESADVRTSGVTATYADKIVGTHAITFYGSFSMTGGTAGNYTIIQPAGITGTITARPVTITGISAHNKEYDSKTTAAIITQSPAISGNLDGSNLTFVSTGAEANFVDKNVGNGKDVTFNGYELDGTAKGNYTLLQPTGVKANITAKALTITNVEATNRNYNGTMTVALTGGSLVGAEPSDDVNFTRGNGVMETADVGNNKEVTTSITLIGADAGNYTLTQPTGIKVTISKASINFPNPIPGLEFNGSPQTGVASGPGYTVENGILTNAGAYIATVTLNDPVNYKWSDSEETAPRTISWSIAKAPQPVIQWPTTTAVTYTPDLLLSSVPFSGGSTNLGVFSWTTGTTVLTAGTTNRQMTLTLNEIAKNNYAFSTETVTRSVSVTVNKATATVTLNLLPDDNMYGSAPFSIDSYASSNSPADIKFRLVSATPAAVNIDVQGWVTVNYAGSARVQAYVDESPNYTAATSQYRDLIIRPANLYLTVESYKIQEGKLFPDVFPYTYSGFVNDDDETILNGELRFSTTYINQTLFTINAYGLTADNYTVHCVPGRLEITKQPVLIATVNRISRPYGNENPPLNITYSGFENGDNEYTYRVKTEPVAFCDATPQSLPDDYIIRVTGGSDDNYIVQPVWSTLTVTKAPVRVQAENKTRVEGQPNPELTFNYNIFDFKLGQDESIIEDPPVPFVDADINTTYGQVNIVFQGGEDDPRYTFEHIPGVLYIQPAEKVVIYGDPPFELPINPGVRAWTEPEGIIDLGTDDKGNVIATILQGGDTRIRIDGSPYPIQVIVNKANLRVWVNDTTRIQGATNPNFKIRYQGFVYDDDDSVFETPFRAECEAKPYDPPQVFEIRVVGGSSTKYEIQRVSGYLEILPGRILPTAFTPNGDGINDIWPWIESNYKVQIFNRLGMQIYTGDSGWDGRYNGRLVAPDVYFYKAISPDGVVFTGTVEVIKPR